MLRSLFGTLLLFLLVALDIQAFYHLPNAPCRTASHTCRYFFGGRQQPKAEQDLVRASSSSNLPGTTLVLRHPTTGSQVYIVGCVHGSEASEEDVATVFRSQNPAAVVLELCQSRFESMQAEEAKYQAAIIEEDKQLKAARKIKLEIGASTAAAAGTDSPNINAAATTRVATGGPTGTLSHVAGGLAEWGRNLHTFSKQHGPMQTVLIALLSSSAEVQRVLTTSSSSTSSSRRRRRRRASCEFRTSVELALEGKAGIVLGDQDLNITLSRFKEGIWQWGTRGEEEEEKRRGGGQQALREFASIRNALLGPSDLPRTQRVNVLRLLFTQERYIREVVKVLVPVGLVVLVALRAVETMGDAAIASLNQVLPSLPSSSAVDFISSLILSTSPTGDAAVTTITAAAAAAATAAAPSLLDAEWVSNLSWGGMNAFMLLYFVAINRYILVERDLFLADSIAEASLKGVYKGGKIAAVVGLLHGNGVARHLREKHGFELLDRP